MLLDTAAGFADVTVGEDTIKSLIEHHVTFDIDPGDGAGVRFRVLDHTDSTLTVDTTDNSLTDYGSIGSAYIGAYLFDTVIVRNGARLATDDIIYCDSLILDNGVLSDYVGMEVGMGRNKRGWLQQRQGPVRVGMRKRAKEKDGHAGRHVRFTPRFVPRYEREPVLVASAWRTEGTQCLDGDPVYTYDVLDRVTSMTSPVGTTTCGVSEKQNRLLRSRHSPSH